VDVPRASWLPLALLLGYGVAFAARALGVGPLAFDDHPGQLARLWHVVREGPAPWAWNDGWWAGYPELQFYPPGWFYVGAALSWLTLGLLSPPAIYQALLWITYLAPGVTAFLLLRRLLGAAWPALPGAFLVLAFTGDPAGGAASAVEGGVRIGMVGARLAWALLPLLTFTLVPWIGRGGRFPRSAVALIAAIILTHPTHTPAALAIVAASVLATPAPRRGGVQATLGVLIALGLVAFWLLPLLLRLQETRALAWGSLTLAPLLTPFGAGLLGLALVATSRRGAGVIALHAVWLAALAVALDALVAEPLGVRFLPADRVADGAWMTLLIASGVGAGVIVHAVSRRLPMAAAALGVTAALIAFSLPGKALALWPRAADWPSQASVTRGLRLDDLWRTLRAVPSGRVLFVRSGVPLVYGTAWYRPHTHITALTPVLAGREILGGTFTHGSPIAALAYRGAARPGAITKLAEQLDGDSLLGRPLDALDAASFDAFAARFRVAAVVALEDDGPRVTFLTDNPRYRRLVVPPFLVFVATQPPSPIRRRADGTRDVSVDTASDWASTGIAYYPLWRAERDGRPLATRRGTDGDLEVKVDASAGAVRLVYRAGIIEVVALGASAVVLLGLAWSAVREVAARRHAERGADRVRRIEDPRVQS
jgi:hypothetical protein